MAGLGAKRGEAREWAPRPACGGKRGIAREWGSRAGLMGQCGEANLGFKRGEAW